MRSRGGFRGDSGVQSNFFLTQNFKMGNLDKFDKFGTLSLILLFNKSILLPVNLCKIAGRVANSVDRDQTPRSAASDLGLYCLLRPVCPNIRIISNIIKSSPSEILPLDPPLRYCIYIPNIHTSRL